MNNYILFNKEVGETTSECIVRLREKYPELKDAKIGHLGTLDPMASGLMVFLVGDKTKEFTKLQKLKKVYTFTIVFGIETDSYDFLGIPHASQALGADFKIDEVLLLKTIKGFEGKISQCPPPYSAIKIKGKSLYWWYRNNRQNEIEIKPRLREVYSIDLERLHEFNLNNLEQIFPIIEKIKGDFRQSEITAAWREVIDKLRNQGVNSLPAADLKVQCSSGTYVRSLANDIGKKIDTPCFAYDIKRIAIGKYVFD